MANMKQILQVAAGLFLILPLEDVITGGASTPATAAIGAALIADAFGVTK